MCYIILKAGGQRASEAGQIATRVVWEPDPQGRAKNFTSSKKRKGDRKMTLNEKIAEVEKWADPYYETET